MTRQETALVLEHGLTVSGKPLKDHHETVDHQDALNFVRQLVQGDRPISERDIRDIHRLVTMGTLREEAGSYSKHRRFIVGSTVKLPEPADVPGLMGDLSQWLTASTPSPEAAFEAHLRLVTIHPFSDGNGRTARLLMNLILLKDGYPPLIILPEDRNAYFRNLEQPQLYNDTANYQAFLIKCLDIVLDAYLDFFQTRSSRKTKIQKVQGE